MKKQKIEHTDEVDDGIRSLPDEIVDCFVHHSEPRPLYVYDRQEKNFNAVALSRVILWLLNTWNTSQSSTKKELCRII